MKLSARYAKYLLSGKRTVLSQLETEISDLRKEMREFEEKKVKVQSEIKLLEDIIKQRTRENAVFQNLKPYGEKP
jgi:cell division protein FtsB